jgi:hypothetical protein
MLLTTILTPTSRLSLTITTIVRPATNSIPCDHLLTIPFPHSDLDIPTLTRLHASQKTTPHLFMPLNTLYALPTSLKRGFEVTELDWWNGAVMDVEGVGKARMTALPSQHFTVCLHDFLLKM